MGQDSLACPGRLLRSIASLSRSVLFRHPAEPVKLGDPGLNTDDDLEPLGGGDQIARTGGSAADTTKYRSRRCLKCPILAGRHPRVAFRDIILGNKNLSAHVSATGKPGRKATCASVDLSLGPNYLSGFPVWRPRIASTRRQRHHARPRSIRCCTERKPELATWNNSLARQSKTVRRTSAKSNRQSD